MPNGAKNWVFTLNNYTNDEKEQLGELVAQQPVAEEQPRPAKYLVYGEELGENGTPHLQGYISLGARRTLAWLKSNVSARAHWEVMRGKPLEASNYCKKDGAYTELGELPAGSGTRNDLVSLSTDIRGGATASQIEEKFPGHFIRYRNNILACIRARQPKRTWVMEVQILWGAPGTGKTRMVFDKHGFDDVYTHTGTTWFDGYDGHEIVLFDDFTGSEFKLGYLLKLLDRYPMRVPVKGGFVQWVPKTVYFTSNKDPREWYNGALNAHQQALMRRVTNITHFNEPLMPADH